MQPDGPSESALAHIGKQGEAHSLREHLIEVARLAAENAAPFGCEDWARLAGLWHDLGKYRPGFQKYIRQANDLDAHIEGRVVGHEKTHSAAGALWAQRYLAERLGKTGDAIARVLSYPIAGHHAGLDNWVDGANDGLSGRFSKLETQREFDDTLGMRPPSEILEPNFTLPQVEKIPIDGRKEQPPGAFALWVRMLFSCLVDADFLDTEQFLDAGKFVSRAGYPSIADMAQRFDRYMSAKVEALQLRGDAHSVVNRTRAEVLALCRQKALREPGVFTLTVPTGGGKTFSSLAFAMAHAVRHAKRRVIYAIPFTSIIEQTAEIFRDVFGAANVVEHHSNVESDERAETQRSRLACENWDAPVIVTTNVQLFESLFARKTSRCRKLHNLIGSVIVLDEAQLLPVEFLQPIVDVLGLLVRSYGVTLVLCTATQPSFTSQQNFTPKHQLRGFRPDEITEIVDDVSRLYSTLKRVRVHRPKSLDQKRQWPEIGGDIARHDAVLAIVNRRKDAADLFRWLRADHSRGLFHLSALMCAQHRSDTIAAIKQALVAHRNGSAVPVRVVSTQLVEAGVDLDFPVVYRAMAGLDSIAQAAGRCNREGRLEQGDVFVFVPPTSPPSGLLRQAESECRSLWSGLTDTADPIDVSLYAPYFCRLYAQDLDRKNICNTLRVSSAGEVRFRDAAEAFKLIDEDGVPVLVRYSSEHLTDVDSLLAKLEAGGPQRWLMRKLQRYLVTIYRHDAERLLRARDIRCVEGCPGLYAQVSDVLYDAQLGLLADGGPGDPASLVV
jgi:CRISPR-associated endonuclease/helicase Cas3